MALTKVEAEQLQPAQTSITSVGTLTGLTVGGSTGVNIVADANPVIKFDRGSANTANANLYYNGTLTGQISAANANFQISAAGSSTPMSFYVNGSERMRLLTNGSAVIGGGNSFAQQGGGLLTLEGPDANMLVLHRTADTGDQEIQFYDHGDFNSAIAGKTGGALEFRTNGNSTIAMHITSVGNVGIGTTPDSDVKLHIKGDGARVYVDSADYNLFSIGRRSSSGAGLDQAYLRMKSAGTNTVVLDTAGDTYFNGGNVGIGTASPTQKLDLRGAIRFGDTIADVADGGRPLIYASDGSGAHTGHALVIQARDGAGSEIDFVTGTTPTTRMHIDSSGDVGVGTSSPNNKLHVYKGDSGHTWSFDGGDNLILENSNSISINIATPSGNSGNILFSDNNARGQGRIIYNHPDDSMGFYTSGISNERMRIDSSGNVKIVNGNLVIGTAGKGIDFSATGDGHSTSNRSELLDDYEEGDWTPIIGGSSGQSGQSYNLQNGKYTKIGSFVNCTFDVQLSAQGSFSGTYVVLRNLPFAPIGNNLGGSANFGYISGWSNITYPMSAYISANNVYLMEGLSDYIKVNEYKHGNSSRLIGSIIYHTAS